MPLTARHTDRPDWRSGPRANQKPADGDVRPRKNRSGVEIDRQVGSLPCDWPRKYAVGTTIAENGLVKARAT